MLRIRRKIAVAGEPTDIKEKPVSNVAELETKTLNDLREMARKLDISGVSGLKKQDLIFKLLQAQTEEAGHSLNDGILDIVSDGFGFLRGDRMLTHAARGTVAIRHILSYVRRQRLPKPAVMREHRGYHIWRTIAMQFTSLHR